jgi:hypothetical protein
MVVPPASDAEEIQRQMQSVRSSLRADVKELVENARDMTDWHYYVRRYPWAAVAAAAGVGFLITPGLFARKTPLVADSQTAESTPFVAPVTYSKQPSMINRLATNAFSAATGALSRAAMAVVSQQLSALLASQSASRPTALNQGDQQHVESHF